MAAAARPRPLVLYGGLALALLSLACGRVLLPLAASGSAIAAGVARDALPLFDGLTGLGFLLALGASLYSRMQARKAASAVVAAPMPPVPAPAPMPAPPSQVSEFPVLTEVSRSGLTPKVASGDWSGSILRSMDWLRFMELAVAYYREAGKFCEMRPLDQGYGMDIRLHDKPGGPTTGIVRCWGWGVHRVPTTLLTELKGIMAREGIPEGAWLTNARFGDKLEAYGSMNSIAALDGRRFLSMLQALPSDSRRYLLGLATEGDWMTPTCPACRSKMVRRQGMATDYWACSGFPTCDSILPARSEGPKK